MDAVPVDARRLHEDRFSKIKFVLIRETQLPQKFGILVGITIRASFDS